MERPNTQEDLDAIAADVELQQLEIMRVMEPLVKEGAGWLIGPDEVQVPLLLSKWLAGADLRGVQADAERALELSDLLGDRFVVEVHDDDRWEWPEWPWFAIEGYRTTRTPTESPSTCSAVLPLRLGLKT